MLHPLPSSTPDPVRRARPLLRTTLGIVLRGARLEQGRTLADVAAAAKVSMQYLSEVERGRKEASSEVLAAICDALDVGLPDVLGEVGRRLAGAVHAQVLHGGEPGTGAIPSASVRQSAAYPAEVTCLLAA